MRRTEGTGTPCAHSMNMHKAGDELGEARKPRSVDVFSFPVTGRERKGGDLGGEQVLGSTVVGTSMSASLLLQMVYMGWNTEMFKGHVRRY